MNSAAGLPTERFLQTLEIVAREGKQLSYSWSRLFCQAIDVAWVRSLDNTPEIAEQLEALVSRFGRMQDTMGDKLLPRWLIALAEKPGSHIETLNRTERLGVLTSTEQWLEARHLRNRLVHEYITDLAKFVEDLALVKEYSLMLLETYNRLREDAVTRMGFEMESLPEALPMPRHD